MTPTTIRLQYMTLQIQDLNLSFQDLWHRECILIWILTSMMIVL